MMTTGFGWTPIWLCQMVMDTWWQNPSPWLRSRMSLFSPDCPPEESSVMIVQPFGCWYFLMDCASWRVCGKGNLWFMFILAEWVSLFCPVIFWPILSCAVIVWSGLVWFMCAWWIIDLLVFIVHFKTLAYDAIWCNVLADLENEIYNKFPEENFLSDHLGKSFHIVDAVTWHAKLVGIVAQASEIQEHLWSTNGKMIFQINMYYLQVKSTAQIFFVKSRQLI